MPARKYTDKCNNGHPNNYTTTRKGNTYCLDCSRSKSLRAWEREDRVLYMTWSSMRRRCNNRNAQNYYLYGDRGIKVCERWDSYENFKEDMGERPSKEHSLDRIDHEGNYGPDNCRWATRLEQSRNKRNNHFLEFEGTTKTLSEWATIYGLSVQTLFSRLTKYKWSVAQALTTPAKVGNNQTLFLNAVRTAPSSSQEDSGGEEW